MKHPLSLTLFVLLAAPAFAVDGVVLINQSTAMAGGGFPVVISQPGSYQLSGNLVVPDSNTTAILVTASNVSIDLNGFSILGPNGCDGLPFSTTPVVCGPFGSGNGIGDSGAPSFVSVSNGVIAGLGNAGIYLTGTGDRVDRVRASSGMFIGIALTGAGGSVSSSTAYLTQSFGIEAASVIGCSAISNFGDGIRLFGGLAQNNITTGNQGTGLSGGGFPAAIIGNTSTGNATGLFATCPSVLSENTTAQNSLNVNTSGSGCLIANSVVP